MTYDKIPLLDVISSITSTEDITFEKILERNYNTDLNDNSKMSIFVDINDNNFTLVYDILYKIYKIKNIRLCMRVKLNDDSINSFNELVYPKIISSVSYINYESGKKHINNLINLSKDIMINEYELNDETEKQILDYHLPEDKIILLQNI